MSARNNKNSSQQPGLQDYQLKLTFEGPLLSQATGTMALGLDVEMQKSDSKPALNGSLIRGNIRHALTEFAPLMEKCNLSHDINRWFGDQSNDEGYEPQRSNVDFDFFWRLDDAYKLPELIGQRTRIEINRESGSVNEGSLQVIEDCFPTGSDNPTFSGKITLHFQHQAEKKRFKKWLKKALEFIPAMGSFKGVGFGRLVSAELEEINNTQLSNSTQPEDHTHFGIRLKLDRPFCIGKPRTSDSNQIISEEMITGNLIKALIARKYQNSSDKLKEELSFDQLIITHALPTDRETLQRKHSIPLSLAVLYHDQTKEAEVIDMAMSPAITKWQHVPSFAPDWKEADYEKINDFIKPPEIRPERLLTLRTEINAASDVSEESRLFSQECIDPSKYDWCADVNLCNIPEKKRAAVFKELQNIFNQGLSGIGKTKAHAKVTLCKTAFIQKSAALKPGKYIITLTTEARMLPPDLRMQGTNSAQDLKDQYQKYWATALSGQQDSGTQKNEGIQLIDYYAQQTLTSTYYHKQRHNPDQEKYYPEWLTNAGSVFVLEINNKKALEKLETFSHAGLKAHAEAGGAAATWKTTPYLPEHGYGEIQVKAMGEAK